MTYFDDFDNRMIQLREIDQEYWELVAMGDSYEFLDPEWSYFEWEKEKLLTHEGKLLHLFELSECDAGNPFYLVDVIPF